MGIVTTIIYIPFKGFFFSIDDYEQQNKVVYIECLDSIAQVNALKFTNKMGWQLPFVV